MAEVTGVTFKEGGKVKEADYIHRNFDLAEVQAAYKDVCGRLMRIQQAINVANLTKEFDVDVAL